MSCLFALALALLQPATPPPATPVPEETARTFVRILRTTPLFAPGTKRTIVEPLAGTVPPQAPFPVYVVEVPWTSEQGKGTAVALFIDMPGFAVANGVKVDELKRELRGAEGTWGLAELADDRTLAAWIEEKNQARRAALEATAIGDLRMMSSIQATLLAGGGSYALPECFADPKACYGAWTGPALPDMLLLGDKAGYRRAFHAGAVVPQKGRLASKLIRNWAMTARPLAPETGRRSFCVDASGVVCATSSPAMDAVVEATCPRSCTPLK